MSRDVRQAVEGEPYLGALGVRELSDDMILVLYPMTFGNTRLCLGLQGVGWYDRGWCFHDTAAAYRGLAEWDGEGEPDGYYKRVGE